jgi:low temperature requirement protein LtrA
MVMARPRLIVRPTQPEHRVTTLELFFDLVFVFAITQVTALMASEPTAQYAVRGLLLMAMLWWAWCCYAWLGNQARADEGAVRAGMVVAMAGLFLVGLAIPDAWGDGGAGLPAALVLAGSLAVVRFAHLAVYFVAAGDDSGLRRQLVRTAVPVAVAAVLLVIGALVGGPRQTVLWAVALAVDYVGIYAAGADGWRLPAPRHFAERHGLIVIIAIGESIVSIGVGAAGLPLTWPVIGATLLGLTVALCLWWTYFDVVALVAERVLSSTQGTQRARLARDSFTYLHFPMVTGIVYLALGLKKVLVQVADTGHYALSDPLSGVAAGALFGGVSAYLLGHLAFRLRNVHSLNKPRAAVAILTVAAVPLAMLVPALLALALLAAALVALVAYESVAYADARHAIRSADDDGLLPA